MLIKRELLLLRVQGVMIDDTQAVPSRNATSWYAHMHASVLTQVLTGCTHMYACTNNNTHTHTHL